MSCGARLFTTWQVCTHCSSIIPHLHSVLGFYWSPPLDKLLLLCCNFPVIAFIFPTRPWVTDGRKHVQTSGQLWCWVIWLSMVLNNLIMCLFGKIIVIESSLGPLRPQPWVLDQVSSSNHAFSPVDGSLYLIRKQLLSPMDVPLLH